MFRLVFFDTKIITQQLVDLTTKIRQHKDSKLHVIRSADMITLPGIKKTSKKWVAAMLIRAALPISILWYKALYLVTYVYYFGFRIRPDSWGNQKDTGW